MAINVACAYNRIRALMAAISSSWQYRHLPCHNNEMVKTALETCYDDAYGKAMRPMSVIISMSLSYVIYRRHHRQISAINILALA